MSYRNILITIFNYDKEELEELLRGDESIFSYCTYQEEECPTTKRKHIQFYGELTRQSRMNKIKKFLGDDTVHIEGRRGTQKQAIAYCSKEDTKISETVIVGTPREQGGRTDLNIIRDKVKSGVRLTEIVNQMERVNYQAVRMAQTLMTVYSIPRSTKPIVIWLYGATGKGKTRYVYDNYPDIYSKNISKWWDGYEQNETILIDDYRKDFSKFHELLKLIDRYPCQREIKGGTIQINSKYIIFTSPASPLKLWEHRRDEDMKQLKRRIDYIIDIEKMPTEIPLCPPAPLGGGGGSLN